MNKPSFTPGPWYIFSCPEKYPGIESEKKSIIIFGSEGDSTGVRGDSKEEILANANLIAAAPDMYAALEACHEAMAYMSEYGIPISLPDQVKAALAKARGENDSCFIR